MSSPVLKRFRDHLPIKPYCTDDLGAGLKILPLRYALGKAYIQHNHPGMVWVLAFDVDREIVDPNDWWPVWDRAGLPEPNLATQTISTRRGHLLYFLEAGVCTTAAARLKPMEFLAAIERAYTVALGADPGYAKLVTKNPCCDRWLVWQIHAQPYTLGELAEYVDLTPHRPLPEASASYGTGRNVTLFHETRFWAYGAIREYWSPNGLPRWHKAVLGHVEALNGQFQKPLPHSETKAIAKSIATWTWKKITPQGLRELIERTHSPEKQRERGKRNTPEQQATKGKASGEARRAAREDLRATARLMRAAGHTQQAIADALGVPQQTLSRWLRNSFTHEQPISDNSPRQRLPAGVGSEELLL
ncbi:MAG: replication initiation protein [Acidithiobacillus sp.]|nr:replication initiation protein [Acidithiobacillus sp.]